MLCIIQVETLVTASLVLDDDPSHDGDSVFLDFGRIRGFLSAFPNAIALASDG